MQWGAFAGMSGIAAVTAVVVAQPETQRYAIPERTAADRLASATLPEPLLGMVGRNFSLVREDGALVWRFGDSGNRSTFRVTLAGDGAATDVGITFDIAANVLGDTPLSDTKMIRSMAEGMFREHVDAVLVGRSFDPHRAMTGMAQQLQSDPEMMREYGQALGDQFNEVATMLNEDFDVATGDLPDGRDAVAPNRDATRPTTTL